MKSNKMPKSGSSSGSNATPAAMTQNVSELSPTVSRLRAFSSMDMDIPGDGNVARAAGGATEGSVRKYADAMDAVFGAASEPVREASDGNSH